MVATLFLLACSFKEETCQLPYFEDQWLQIEFRGSPVGDCYNFLSDGRVIISDGSQTIPAGRWVAQSFDCFVSVFYEEQELKLLNEEEDCIEAELEGVEFSACSCTLF